MMDALSSLRAWNDLSPEERARAASENQQIEREGPPVHRTIKQRLRRIRCWFRGYHVEDPSHIGKFRYDVSGMCFDCGKVGTGWHEEGE
jgi:hypothetical protein